MCRYVCLLLVDVVCGCCALLCLCSWFVVGCVLIVVVVCCCCRLSFVVGRCLFSFGAVD